MARKQTLSTLMEKRKKLDEEIATMQKEELAAVARWILNKTGCVTMQELTAAGWVLSKRPPVATQDDRDEEQKEPAADAAKETLDDWMQNVPVN